MNEHSDKSISQHSKSDDLLQLLFRATAMSSRQGIKPRSAAGPAPLSAFQQQMWFLNQLNPGVPVYNTFRAFYLTGKLDLRVLEDCIKEIVRRHDSLRTVFILEDGVPVQAVRPDMGFDFSFRDLSGVDGPDSAGEKMLNELLVAEAQRTFDLSSGPCLRVFVFRLREDKYCFQLVMHHISCDGWSLSALFRELAALYEAFSQGKASPLHELPVQYPDYAEWQQQWLKSDALRIHLDYWIEQLRGAPVCLDLSTDFPRPPAQSFVGGLQDVIISRQLTDRLKTFSSDEGVTLFMTLLAAYQLLLCRYSGQTDIVTGSPIANRNHSETHDMIGCFVNTLALRTDLSGTPGFRELVARVRKTTLDAYAHQDLPFQVLIEKIHSRRDMTFTPLFQASFVLQNTPELTLEFSGLTMKPLRVDNMSAKYDLNLILSEYDGELRGKLEYSTDLFKTETIRRLIGHFNVLLEGVLRDPYRPVSEVSLLTEDEKHQLLVEWNNTARDYPRDRCIHELFEEQVERTPDSVAVIFEDKQLTYRELNSSANQLAHYLRKHGVGPEVLVGICVERSPEMIIGILGILKAGGAYVPLDPEYPKDRLNFMIEDTLAPVILTQQRLLSILPEKAAKVISLDSDCMGITGAGQENLFSGAKPTNLAYVMYTSGSTGRPKGVCVLHRGVVRLVKETSYVNLASKEVCIQHSSISFDASTFEIWGSLLNGAKLVVMPPGIPSPEELEEAIKQQQITTIWLTASLFHLMVDERVEAFKNVRHLLAGGDVLSVSHVLRFLQEHKTCQLINGYGPTENTTFTCCHTIEPPVLFERTVPIGRPIANTKVHVLDRHLQPVPVGVHGELYAGGDGLARGYLNRPELTAEKFIPDPFSAEPGSRLYRTGDLARYLPDGNIEFLGRIDHQVKVRGYRIEPGEIESVLLQHPDVTAALVTAIEERGGDKRLAGYVVVKDTSKDITHELKKMLKYILPDYLVPSALMIMKAFPLTPNGKIDLAALAAPFAGQEDQGQETVRPSSPFEEKLLAVWKAIFKRDDIGINDDFFELGGHSLLAMRLIAWVRRETNVELPIHSIFEFPTIAGLAQIAERTSR